MSTMTVIRTSQRASSLQEWKDAMRALLENLLSTSRAKSIDVPRYLQRVGVALMGVMLTLFCLTLIWLAAVLQGGVA